MNRLHKLVDVRGEVSEVKAAAFAIPKSLGAYTAWAVGFRVLNFVVLAPVVTLWMNWAVSMSGNASVSNFELIELATNPWSAVLVYTAIIFSIALLFFEQSGLLIISDAAQRGRRMHISEVVMSASSRWPQVLQLVAWGLGFVTVVAIPFGVVGFTLFKTFLGEQDINYYLDERPPEYYQFAVIAGGLILVLAGICLFVGLRFFFCVPACVLGGKSARESMSWSWQASREKKIAIIRLFGVWFGSMFLIAAFIGLLVQLCEWLLFAWAGDRLGQISISIAAIFFMNSLSGAILSFVGVTTGVLVMYRLYRQALDINDEHEGVSTLPLEEPADGEHVPWFARRFVILGVLAGVVLVSGLSSYGLVKSALDEREIAVTAHRGDVTRAPENSLPAIQFAIDLNCEYVEIDVQQTSDRQVVLCHDVDFLRIAGDPRKVWNLTLEEVKSLDIGSRYSPDFQGEQVPTLAEVFDLADGKIKVNIELKPTAEQPELVGLVVELIQEYDFHDQCIVSSLNHRALAEVRKLDPKIRLCANISVSVGKIGTLDVEALSISAANLDRKMVDNYQSRGYEVHAWTINDEPTMRRFIEIGVDNILTDEPALLQQLIEERESLEPVQRVLLRFRTLLE